MEEQVAEFSAAVEEASKEFLGHWNRLVSTTNWEKGRIIFQWRQRLVEAGAPASVSSDEAWSRQVGNVSPQHVGRLRRVYQRFNDVATQYPGLYWSHFQAALEWTDAEMYLEGAMSNGWSVAQMRQQRWEAMGVPPDKQVADEEVVAAEFDEDVTPEAAAEEDASDVISTSTAEVFDPEPCDTPVDAEADEVEAGESQPAAFDAEPADVADAVRPFADIPSLPTDLADAAERFKLAIVRHKASNWQEIDCRHVLATLDGLKQLATAPA
jgi:hypothetical protein